MSAAQESGVTPSIPPLGIVAGGGILPLALVRSCSVQGRPVVLALLSGAAKDGDFESIPDRASFSMGQAGRMIRFFRSHGVRDLVLIGPVRRPSWWQVWPDFWTLRNLLPLLFQRLGDDGLLRGVRSVLEREGFALRGVHDFLPSLLSVPGPLGRVLPDEGDLADIQVGLSAARKLGVADVGQAVVVQQGKVLGEEDSQGTDYLIARCGSLKRPGRGPVLIKAAKPGQDRDLDLPTIGPGTLRGLIAQGYRGVAVASGETLIVEPETISSLADSAGVFVVGVSA